MKFSDFLVEKKIISKNQLKNLENEAIKTGAFFDDLLLSKKIILERDLFKAKSEFLEVPLLDKIPENTPEDVLTLLPRETVDFYKMAPLSINRQEGVLEIGMVNPQDQQARQALQFLSRQNKFAIKIFLLTPSDFNNFVKKYRKTEKEIETALQELKTEDVAQLEKESQGKELNRLVEEAPVIKMVAVILRQAVEGGASDVHIEPQQKSSRARFRFDGVLYSSLELPYRVHNALVARIKILSGLKIDETRLPQDGRFSTMVSNQKVDFRVATFPTTLGEKVVLRILKTDQGLQTLENLGMEGDNLRKTQTASQKPYGMILVTGPTGSGKSTTLYALLSMLNKEGVNIVTLEDPVEYSIEGVSQSQVNPDIGYTFSKGLRQILRQDPDIIMVGEIRDEETANLAVHAALTGHLVLSTLHTNTAVGAAPRLVDMGIKPFLLPASLILVVGQRLLRKLCPYCKEKVSPSLSEKTYLQNQIKSFPEKLRKEYQNKPLFVFKPGKCNKCSQKGYKGRAGVFEVLEMTPGLANVINQTMSEQEMLKEARAQEMITMEQDAVIKVLEGATSLEEIASVAQEV